jgi:gliding motility-associated-like protein
MGIFLIPMIMNIQKITCHQFALKLLGFFLLYFYASTFIFAQNSQTIFYNNPNKIGTIDIATCDTTLLFEVLPPWGVVDITFDINGNLIGLGNQRIFKIDLVSKTLNPLPVIGNHAFTAMTTDKEGRILIAGISIFGEVDPISGSFTEIGALPVGLSPHGDMTFYKGRLLLTSRTSSPITHVLVEVNMNDPSASVILTELVFPGDTIGNPGGLVTLLDNCENQRVIIVGSKQNLYELNMDDYSVTPLCAQPHGFTGAALKMEYLASACDLLLDLDFDNSSGAVGFDWLDSIKCMSYASPLCDEDVYVHAEARIDSLTIWLEGTPPDGDKEYLWFGGYPGLTATVGTGPSITLVNEGNITHMDWEQAILSMRYQHDGPIYTPGPRQVAFLLHSTLRAGDTVRATLHLPEGMPWAGRDTIVNRCRDAGDIPLSDLLSLDAMGGGIFSPSNAWQPASSPDTTLVNYIVSHPECPSDTALLTLIALELPEVDLGPDQVLCDGDEWMIMLDGNASFLWQDGSTSNSYLATAPGIYQITATNINGCTATDAIEIEFSPPPAIANEGLLRLCPEDQQSWFDQMIDGPGTYTHGISGSNGCDSIQHLLEVIYDSQPDVTLTGDTVLCEAATGMLQLTPGYTYQWAHGPVTAEVVIQQPGTYSVTVTDGQSVCVRILEVEVKSSPLIVLPDIQVNPPLCPDDEAGTIILGQLPGGQPPLLMRIEGELIYEDTIVSDYLPGSYLLEVEDVLGCKKSIIITVPQAPAYTLQTTPEVILEAGTIGTITAGGTIPPPVTYTWHPPSLIVWQEANQVGVTTAESGLLNLTAIDANGCVYEATIQLIVQDNTVLYIPTAFSPNEDGINDVWMPVPGNEKEYFLSNLSVFDRWGNLIYQNSGPAGTTGWDGKSGSKMCDPGVYVFMFTIEGESQNQQNYSGEIILLR